MRLKLFRKQPEGVAFRETEPDSLRREIGLVNDLLLLVPGEKSKDFGARLLSFRSADFSSQVKRNNAKSAVEQSLQYIFEQNAYLWTLMNYIGKPEEMNRLEEQGQEMLRTISHEQNKHRYEKLIKALAIFDKLVELFGNPDAVFKKTTTIRRKLGKNEAEDIMRAISGLVMSGDRALISAKHSVSRDKSEPGYDPGTIIELGPADFAIVEEDDGSGIESNFGREALEALQRLREQLKISKARVNEVLMDACVNFNYSYANLYDFLRALGVKRLDELARFLGVGVDEVGKLLLKFAEGEVVFTDFIKRKSPELFLKIKTNPKLKWALEFAGSGYEMAIVTVRRRWLLTMLSILVATWYTGDGVKRDTIQTLLITKQKSEQPGKAKRPEMQVKPKTMSSPQIVEKPAAPDSSAQVDVSGEEIVIPDAPPVPSVALSDSKVAFDTNVADAEVTDFFKNRFGNDTKGVLFQKLVIYLLTLNESEREEQIQNWKRGGYPDPSETNTLFQDAIANRPGSLKPYVSKTVQTGGVVSPNEALNSQIAIFLQNHPALHPGHRK